MNKINTTQTLSLAEATTLIERVGANCTMLLRGEPGIGKSTILKTLADRMPEYHAVYLDATLLDLGDLQMPLVNDGGVQFVPNKMFVSDKPQTTRTRVLGVKNYPDGQVVFVEEAPAGLELGLRRIRVDVPLAIALEQRDVLGLAARPRVGERRVAAGVDLGDEIAHLGQQRPRLAGEVVQVEAERLGHVRVEDALGAAQQALGVRLRLAVAVVAAQLVNGLGRESDVSHDGHAFFGELVALCLYIVEEAKLLIGCHR